MDAKVADAFDEMAELLAIAGENPFRSRAYQRAALTIRGLPRPLADVLAEGGLEQLPGIGTDLAAKIEELLSTGRLKALERLRKQVPAGLRDLLRLPGLGPARVRELHRRLGVNDVPDLRRAIAEGRLANTRGFGDVLVARLRDSLATSATPPHRWPRGEALRVALPLRDYLLGIRGVEEVEIAGSFRRGLPTVGDLDFVVSGDAGVDLASALRRYPSVKALEVEGRTRCTARLVDGLQVDVRLVGPESFGAALCYFTGSRAHSIALRHRAQERGLKLNEYGLFRGRRRIAGEHEADIFKALGLPWIPPERREDRGEIEAAEHRGTG